MKRPDCLTTGKATSEVSWFALREHVRSGEASEDELGNRDLACIVQHWPANLKRLRGRGIHFPEFPWQLLLDRNAEPAAWLLPYQMSCNPGWLSPLHRLLERVVSQARHCSPGCQWTGVPMSLRTEEGIRVTEPCSSASHVISEDSDLYHRGQRVAGTRFTRS